jgi:hypothetical protein
LQRRSALKILGTGLLADRAEIVKAQLFQIASSPATYKLQFFTPAQNEMAAVLTEMIIPADEHSGGAQEAHVNLFIDLTVGNSAEAVRKEWTAGLAAFDAEANARFGKTFVRLDPAQRHQVMTTAAKNEEHPATPLEQFFGTLKTMTLNGYYTSATGIHRELNYKGNTALPGYYGCTHPQATAMVDHKAAEHKA